MKILSVTVVVPTFYNYFIEVEDDVAAKAEAFVDGMVGPPVLKFLEDNVEGWADRQADEINEGDFDQHEDAAIWSVTEPETEE